MYKLHAAIFTFSSQWLVLYTEKTQGLRSVCAASVHIKMKLSKYSVHCKKRCHGCWPGVANSAGSLNTENIQLASSVVWQKHSKHYRSNLTTDIYTGNNTKEIDILKRTVAADRDPPYN
ncbi:hypothetical protein BaRGS_00012797 [Batillaria attramentaria]|uniref:Uncharacterized protein n=1 Tax=Batillaria attramentaria TaxID=370345 RepID=A0ABD0L9X9_9CAEN